uniref:glycosyl hydrolase family 18 protein n=1 Tax=Microcystis sp. M058S1 TaxID=2771123 RepID=UPI002589674F|nr:glycosyl hydrolase family 18 protein [Microcystis sp. M058S1]
MTSTLLPSLPAVDDVLFNFAQSDGLSQANRVDSVRNQRLTATVVFLDAGVADYQSLQAGVIPEVATVILTPNQDGIEQISAFLQQNPQITTIHLVSHGAPGCLYLGNCQLNLTNIYDYRQQLHSWAKINHILLYGCQVAAGDAGTEFIEKLHQLTGATVMASATPTGSSKWGGDWELEVIVSRAESEQDLNISLAFVGGTLATYEGVFALSLVGNYDTPGWAFGVEVVGNYAYLADYDSGLQIIDISNPTNPIFKGNYDTDGAWDVEVVGNYAYLADGSSGLQIINISNPTNPTFIGNYDNFSAVVDVQVVGNYAYLANGDSLLQIIDISNPTNPILKGSYDDSSGFADGVQVVGNYAYIADYFSGLQIIDISNPTNPILKGIYNTSGNARDVEVVGNYAYVADYDSGLQIIDISNPTNPTFKGNYYSSGEATDVQVVGNYAYLAAGGGGLQIIDISNPTNPTIKGNYQNNYDYAFDVKVVSNYAYVAAREGGLQIIDVSEFTNPQTVTLAVSPSSVNEDGTTNLVYTFTRTGSTTSALTANYTVGGTATFSTDYTQTGAASYTATTGTVNFLAGSSTATVTVDPTADTTVESDETVALSLAAGTGYTVGTPNAATGTITNDDTSVTLAVSPSSVTEDGTTNLIYTFTRTGVTTNSLTVNYTVGGTATNGTDYTSIPTSVTFAAGSATATVIVDPTADTTVESDETVVLTLASGTGYTVGTTAAVTGTITNDDNSGNNPYILGGYIGSWNLNSNTPIDATFNKLTHLFYSFADVTSNGTVQLPQDGTGTGDIAKLQQIKAQNPNLKIMLSIGGGTENDFSAAAATVQSRANFAQSAIQLMKTNGFDGLDIDWEYPEANEDNNYIQLLAQLRQQINQASQNDGKQYLLTTALSGSPYILSASDYGSNPYDFSPQDLKATSDYVDFINVMSYDYHGPWENTTNHQSALYKSTNDNTYNAAKVNTNWAIQHYLSAGVPATDIVLGAPLYGRTWTGVNAGSNNGLFQQGTGSSELTYRELYNLLGTNGYQSFWDNSAKVPYIYSSQTKVFSTYENNQSILGKTDYVKQLGIGGAFFWEITQDLPITHSDSLINAAATNLGINNVVLPTITLAVSPSSVLENGLNNLIYTFTRTGATTNALTVNYGITGTADSSDYTGATPGTGKTITFAASASTATLIIDPTADTTVESDETVALTLASGTGYTVGTTTPVTGTITNSPVTPSITLAVSPSSVTEDGTTNLVYTFTRSGVTTNPLTVNYTLGGTATLNTDYTRTGTNNTVTFAAGSSTATVTVDPTADTIVESNETVALTLAAGTGYTVGTPNAATGTITNDDTSVTLAVSPASVTEDGTSNLVYTFTRNGVTTNPLTVNYTLGGTATLNTDYTRTGTNNTVTFAAGSSTATVTVDPTADTIVESDETVILTLASGTGYTVGTTTPVTGTINNDDFSQLSINNITVVEGLDNNAILTVTVDNPNPQPITFNYTTGPIDATANVDYTSKTATITIAPNTSTATISIPILNDNLNEADEVFTVTLSNPVNATINPEGGIGEVIITDTWQTSLTRTLPNNVENLRLIGSNNINGTGNASNNNITGNSGNNQINGGAGIDNLTGGLGADTFIFQFGQSTISTSDRITDFAINSDKIDLLTQGGLPMNAPSSFSRAANSTVTTLQNLINQVFTDANGATTGNQELGVNSAALVQVTTGAIAGTYLVINDSTAGFQSSNDLLINITGFTGTLPALGNITVGNFFV